MCKVTDPDYVIGLLGLIEMTWSMQRKNSAKHGLHCASKILFIAGLAKKDAGTIHILIR
jgi:hypothetical protein